MIRIDREAETSVYQQIAHQLVKLIRDGILQPGSRLPGSRELAVLLQVHRKTVVAAYDELNAQDWIEAMPRKGISVSARLPELKPKTFKAQVRQPSYAGPAAFGFNQSLSIPQLTVSKNKPRIIINDGSPDSRLAPTELLLRAYKELLTERNYKKFNPQESFAGTPPLREALTRFLTDTRGLTMNPENILITRGAQMAIYLAAQMILKKGDSVIVSRPNYFMADKVFEQAGAQLLRVPADEQGMDVDAVEALCQKKKPRMLYVIPHHHHPTTVTLSMDRRMKLLDIIRRHQLVVIEDDYDYDFHYSSGPILPLASADHGGNVIYIGSLTKSLTPSIRLGYMIGPPDFIAQVTQLRRIIDIRGDHLQEDALATLIRNGDLARHLKKAGKIYHHRRDYFCDLLTRQLEGRISFKKPDGGLAIWAAACLPLPLLAARAAAMGLQINDGSYYNDPPGNKLRLGFASLRENEMDEAIEVLKKAFSLP
jgi:GntR family transcriptional regulator / MocR family aminotransferase